jgi:hypothetical protein
MAYGLGDAIIKLIDQVGTSQDDVPAPESGTTILYTTEQGLVLERAPAGLNEARQWFLDQPVLLNSHDGDVGLTDTPQSILDVPYEIPDDIDASFPTYYRLEAQIVVGGFAPDASSIGILVVPYVDGSASSPVIVPCDSATGIGGSTVTFFVSGSSGESIDLRAYVINAGDVANANVVTALLKREVRVPAAP